MSHTPPTAPVAAVQTADELLDAAEVARRLRLSLATVYRLVRGGELQGHRFGRGKVRPRGLRITESSVTTYLRESALSAENVA